jgi:hypothetical protein
MKASLLVSEKLRIFEEGGSLMNLVDIWIASNLIISHIHVRNCTHLCVACVAMILGDVTT